MRKNNLKRLWLDLRNRFGNKKTKEEKLTLLVNDIANELFNDTFEGKVLTSTEISFVVFSLKETVRTRLLNRADHHGEEQKSAIDAANKL